MQPSQLPCFTFQSLYVLLPKLHRKKKRKRKKQQHLRRGIFTQAQFTRHHTGRAFQETPPHCSFGYAAKQKQQSMTGKDKSDAQNENLRSSCGSAKSPYSGAGSGRRESRKVHKTRNRSAPLLYLLMGVRTTTQPLHRASVSSSGAGRKDGLENQQRCAPLAEQDKERTTRKGRGGDLDSYSIRLQPPFE